ncbi:hypothetical protein NDU88_007261 [Pleurodeles waltl]|uniref:Uncharacterized protein n=1 Tax=Pleurodeles waltl TaxID=8319 RepID=A0AAV7LZD3_PLEWA|nr:hypothetical protein NDU88_007261 [Pleurodeles waltl]
MKWEPIGKHVGHNKKQSSPFSILTEYRRGRKESPLSMLTNLEKHKGNRVGRTRFVLKDMKQRRRTRYSRLQSLI